MFPVNRGLTPWVLGLSILVSMIAAGVLLRSSWRTDPSAIRGEVVETFCFTTGNERGQAHAACGIVCAKRGIPIALFDARAGKTYVLLPAKDKATLPDGLIAAMGREVTVRGDIIERGGSRFLTVKSFVR